MTVNSEGGEPAGKGHWGSRDRAASPLLLLLPSSQLCPAPRDAMCGKIQCQSSAKKPQGTNTVSIDTTIRFNGREVKCRGTYMYTAKDDEEDLSDPGLVMTGTKCGDGMVSGSS